ncbi:SAP domain-containing ribonucleoprotein isoform X6 [Grus americana]|uniref:SAP domain-containing ribonucleoprotein isoform X6 n=1 Tax=Grus americana TaxID=9117 RepID=UPI002407A473|nr:SAP domain-containing ribonucleoprotein isoform X6 [Grus americana]
MAAETVELHKLKLAELKQECLARGLEAKGNKQDLINRLQAYLEEHAEEEANEEDVLGEEIEEEEQKPVEPPVKVEEPPVKSPDVITEKKVVKITSEISQMERMQKRAERFNVPVSLESKKAARAARPLRRQQTHERRRREAEEEKGAVWHCNEFSRGWSYRGHRGKEEEKSRTLWDCLMPVLF